jgi:hypothetical protein
MFTEFINGIHDFLEEKYEFTSNFNLSYFFLGINQISDL